MGMREHLDRATDPDWWHLCYATARDQGYDEPRSVEIADECDKDRYAKKEVKAWGPRHHPPSRTKAAVERLRSLTGDGEAIAEAVADIAREFDVEGLKEVAREFGLESGLSSKGQICRLLTERIGKQKEPVEKYAKDMEKEPRDEKGEWTAVEAKLKSKAEGKTTERVAGKQSESSSGKPLHVGEFPRVKEKPTSDLNAELQKAGENPTDLPGKWKNPDPLNLKAQPADPQAEAKVRQSVQEAVKAQASANAFQRLNLKQLHEQFAAGMTPRQFHGVLARMQDAGLIRLAPYTQATNTHPDQLHLMPYDREFKFYAEPVRNLPAPGSLKSPGA